MYIVIDMTPDQLGMLFNCEYFKTILELFKFIICFSEMTAQVWIYLFAVAVVLICFEGTRILLLNALAKVFKKLSELPRIFKIK